MLYQCIFITGVCRATGHLLPFPFSSFPLAISLALVLHNPLLNSLSSITLFPSNISNSTLALHILLSLYAFSNIVCLFLPSQFPNPLVQFSNPSLFLCLNLKLPSIICPFSKPHPTPYLTLTITLTLLLSFLNPHPTPCLHNPKSCVF